MLDVLRIENFRTELQKRGVPSAQAHRAAQELADHWDDLKQEGVERGLSPEDAEARADGCLGEWDHLAAAFHPSTTGELLLQRYPFVVFALSPVLLFTVVFGLILALGTVTGRLAGWWGRGPGLDALGFTLLGVAVQVAHAGSLVVTQAVFCWLATQYRCGLRYPVYSAVGLWFHGLFHQVTFHAPSPGSRGSLVWSYGLTGDFWSGAVPLIFLAIYLGLFWKRQFKLTS